MKNLQDVIIGSVVNFKNSSTEYFVTSIVSMNKNRYDDIIVELSLSSKKAGGKSRFVTSGIISTSQLDFFKDDNTKCSYKEFIKLHDTQSDQYFTVIKSLIGVEVYMEGSSYIIAGVRNKWNNLFLCDIIIDVLPINEYGEVLHHHSITKDVPANHVLYLNGSGKLVTLTRLIQEIKDSEK